MVDVKELNLNTIVADLLNQWPQAIPIFLHNRMFCVGCSMSPFETLRDAANIYGIVPETLLDEIRQAIQPVS